MSWRPDIRFIIVPGLHGSGPDHWQTHWERALSASRVEQDDWSHADLDLWAARIASASVSDPRPAVLIAHSFGCLATAAAWPRLRAVVQALLLVAPANPARFGIGDRLPRTPLGVPSSLVASRNDPWMPYDAAIMLAADWQAELHDAGQAGHINAASGHGHWQAGHDILRQLLDRTELPAPQLSTPADGMPLTLRPDDRRLHYVL